MWLRMMLLAFLLNGLSPFGLRILAGMGVGRELTPVYLFYWYLGGFGAALVWALREGVRPSMAGILIGTCAALASVAGQLLMGLALAQGVPGNIVFPLAVGASVFIVATGGILFFRERVGIWGKAGIVLGSIAMILLSIGD